MKNYSVQQKSFNNFKNIALNSIQEFSYQFIAESTNPTGLWKFTQEFKTDLPIEQQVEMCYHVIYVDANNALCKFFGYESKNELIGKEFLELNGKRNFDEAINLFINNGYQLKLYRQNYSAVQDANYYGYDSWHGILNENRLVGIFSISSNVTQLEESKKQLHEHAQRYKQLLEDIDDFVFRFEMQPKQKFTYVSPAAYKLTGYHPEEFYNDPELHLKMVHADDRWMLRDYQELKTESKTLVFRWKKKDGTQLWTEQRVKPILDDDGTLIAIEGISRDITDRVKADSELKLEKEKFRIIFESAPDAYYLSNLKGKFLDGNIAAERVTGINKKDIIGQSYFNLNLLPKRYYAKAAMQLAKNALGKATGPDLYTLNRKDGSQVLVEISTYPVKIEGETVVLGIARDVTDRMQMEEFLQKSREMLNEAQSIAQIGSWELDVDSNELSWSDETFRIYGLKPQSISPTVENIFEFVHPDDREMVRNTFDQAVKNKRRYNIDHRILLKNGSIKYVKGRAKIYYDRQGNPIRLIGTVHDITQIRTAETELQSSWERYIKLFETSPNILIVSDLDTGKILEVNKAGLAVIGVSFEKLIGKTSNELGLVDNNTRELLLDKLAQDGQYSDIEINVTLPSGEKKVALAYGQIIQQANRNALFQTIVDITERKKAEEILQKHHDNLEDLVRDRTKELTQQSKELLKKTQQLKDFNKIMLQRENRIIEMKEEVNNLCRDLGRELVYPPVWGRTIK